MRKFRVAAILAAAVGLGVFAVGCGPVPGTDKIDTSKVSKASGDVVSKASDKAAEVGELGKKLTEADDAVNKELDPLKKAFDALKEKLATGEKEAGADAVKMKALEPLKSVKDEAEKIFKDIGEKLTGLKGLKDIASLDGAKKAIMDLIEKLKPMLKDFMPKG
jgi:hypothetical protein